MYRRISDLFYGIPPHVDNIYKKERKKRNKKEIRGMKFRIKWNKRKIKEEKNYRKINSEVRRLKKKHAR